MRVEHAALDLANGQALDVVSFGRMRMIDLHRLAVCAGANLTFACAAGRYTVWINSRRHEIAAVAVDLESAAELALARLTFAQRDAGTVAMA